MGVTCDDEPRAAARETRPWRRGAYDARRHLQLVHQRLQHRRPERRQGPARRVGKLMMRCAKCGTDNREGAKFCSECATAFAAKCPKCGAVNIPSAKFCDECAA